MGAAPELEIIFQDNHLLAVNKPAGVLTQASGRDEDNLEDRARQWVKVAKWKPGNVYLHAVHRLDRVASGVVLFARTEKALSRLNAEVRERRVSKVYLALVTRAPTPAAGRLEHALRHGAHRAEVEDGDDGDAKPAALAYQILRQDSEFCLLEVRLETGRYHQIRAQLAAIGCPIAGDVEYGGSRDWRRPGIALHHHRLGLNHPTLRTWQEFVAPCPASWPLRPAG